MKTMWSVLDKSFDNDFWSLWDRGLDRRISKSKIDTKEDSNGVSVTFDVPGYDKESLDISVINNVLKIQGDIEGREFENSWKINNNVVDIENIKATVKNGVLEMHIPYKKPPDETYRIQIE